MALKVYVAPPDGTSVEIPDSVGIENFSVTHKAEEGAVGNGTITFDDPFGLLSIGGHRVVTLIEDAIQDTSDNVIWRGFTADRGIIRGRGEKQGAGRIWQANVVDANSIIQRRIMRGSGNKRPAEKDTARIQWLVGTTEGQIFTDHTTYVFTDHPTSMDPVDFNGQRWADVISDCAEATGKNYWADWFGPLGGGDWTIWYGHPGLPDYTAQLSISNDLADIDGDQVFAMSEDAKMTPDPSRVYSGIYGQFDGGYVYDQSDATASSFARRDQFMSMPNVKSASKAAKRVRRWLADLNTEDVRITCSIWVPPTHVNFVKAGQWVPFKATHFPGYEEFVLCRVLSKTTHAPGMYAQGADTEDEEPGEFGLLYQIDLELSGSDILPVAGNVAARLYWPISKKYGDSYFPDTYFDRTGDDPGPGRLPVPLSGLIEYVELSGHEADIWTGLRILGDGEVDIHFRAGIIAVVTEEVEAFWKILLNGTPIETGSIAESGSDNPRGFSRSMTIEATGVAVSDGDIISAQCYLVADHQAFTKVPNGTGFPDQYLDVTGELA